MKKIIIILGLSLLLLSFNNRCLGQFSLSYHYSSLNKFGLAYNLSQRFWAELKIYSNTYIEDFTPELTLLYNVSVKDYHEFYIGAGGVINYFTGIVLPIGLQVRPFENFKKLSFQIEFEPTIDIENEDLLIQSSAGIRYTFGKNK